MATLTTLENHARRLWPDYRIRQHKRITAPAHLQCAMNAPLRVFALQVSGQMVSGLVGVKLHAHGQQLTAQLRTITRQ